VKIIADLQGAKFRVGMVRDEPVVATEGDQVFFGLSSNSQDWSGPGRITINPTIEQTKLLSAMKVGHIVLLEGGAVQLRVTERASRSTVKTKVIVAGNIYSCRSLHVPELSLECAAITRKDKIDIEALRPLNLDYVALSFAQRAKDIVDLRELLRDDDDDDEDDDVDEKNGGDSKAAEDRPFAPKILAKIERQQALENLDEIAAEAGSLSGRKGRRGGSEGRGLACGGA
jgi:pyruvate kinase